MFFYLSKILDFIISPEVWILVLMIFGFFYINRNPKRSLIFFSIAFVFLLLYTNKFLAYEALNTWEVPVTNLTAKDTAFDAGIVLGGGMVVEDAKNKRFVFLYNPDRILQAIQLYKTKRIKKIIISSGSGSLKYPDMLEASLLRRYLLILDIPASDIVIDSLSNNTFENALNTKSIVEKNFSDSARFLLITSAFHMKRAQACFKKLNVPVKPYTTNKYCGERTFNIDMFIPSVEGCYLWKKYIHESSGYFIYKIMGYL